MPKHSQRLFLYDTEIYLCLPAGWSGTCALVFLFSKVLGGTWWKMLADSHLSVYSRMLPSLASWVQPLLSPTEQWG